MGDCGIVVDGVAFVKDFHNIADYHFQASLDNDIKLLTHVGRILVRRIQCFLRIRNSHKKRLSQFILKLRCQTEVFKAFTSYNLVSLTFTGNRYFGKRRAFTFHQIRHFNVADLSNLINERKGKILFAGFQTSILV